MRTIWLMSAVLLLSVSSASAQVSIGVQGGGVLSSPSVDAAGVLNIPLETKSKLSFQAGLLFDIPFGEDGWRLMPELKYVNKGYNLDLTTTFSIPNVPIPVTANVKGNSSISYIEVPVNIAYALPVGESGNLVLAAGPYVAYGLSGRNNFDVLVSGQPLPVDDAFEFGSESGQVKRFDYGGNLSVGYLTDGGLMLKANYSLGLANLSNEGDGSSYKNNYFGLSLVYFIKRAGE
jgi:hypothetical protein